MSTITLEPIFMNKATLKIGEDNYEKVVGSATLTPTTPVASFVGIDGTATPIVGTPTWLLDLGYPQDWTTEDSLSQYLQANQGTSKEIVLTPATGGKVVTVTVLIVAGPIGGSASAIANSNVSLSVAGQPSLV